MATKLPVYNLQGEVVKEVELPENIFEARVNQVLISEMIKRQLLNRMQGTSSTKGRSEVSGGGKKPWRQKGTGRARVGTTRSPVWVGGGVVFGPTPRRRHYAMPKKERRAGFKSIFSLKTKESNLMLLEKLELDEIKTKRVVALLKNLKLDNEKVVIFDVNVGVDVRKAARNLPNVKVIDFSELNPHDLMKFEKLVMTESALKKLEEVYNNGK
jgi:large subunit ribosomal protein L4